jgi:hypothetical protein
LLPRYTSSGSSCLVLCLLLILGVRRLLLLRFVIVHYPTVVGLLEILGSGTEDGDNFKQLANVGDSQFRLTENVVGQFQVEIKIVSPLRQHPLKLDHLKSETPSSASTPTRSQSASTLKTNRWRTMLEHLREPLVSVLAFPSRPAFVPPFFVLFLLVSSQHDDTLASRLTIWRMRRMHGRQTEVDGDILLNNHAVKPRLDRVFRTAFSSLRPIIHHCRGDG